MRLFVLVVAMFYILYTIIKYVLYGDLVLGVYGDIIKMNDNELEEYIISLDNRLLEEEIANIDNKSIDDFQSALQKIEEQSTLHTKLRSDKVYKESFLDDYRKRSRRLYLQRALKVPTMMFLKDLWVLTPAIVTILTGSFFGTLLTTLAVMSIHSMRTDKVMRETIREYGEADDLEDKVVNILIISFSLLGGLFSQFYFVLYTIALKLI